MNMRTTNRDFLRNYRAVKDKLLNGDIDSVIIPQGEGVNLRIVIVKDKTPFERMTEKIKSKPFKNLRRPEEDLF